MASLKNFSPRQYQLSIFNSCKEKNSLVILPTGIGKTGIALLLAIHRLNIFPESKILLCSPTKPLCKQHTETFINSTDINENEIILYTGMLKANARKSIFSEKKVIIATPQTIQSDLSSNRISLEDFSLLVIDEAHRSRMKYANTLLAKTYISSSKYPLILALTASPGSTKEKINEICDNLFIENVEIRTENDADVKPYLQKKTIEYITVELRDDLDAARKNLRSLYKESLSGLSKIGFNKPVSIISKRDLISLQKQFHKEISKKNPSAFFAISLLARLLKLIYLIELIETQSLRPAIKFINKLKSESTKAAKSLVKLREVIYAEDIINGLLSRNMLHPKMEKLNEIVSMQYSTSPNSKMIIFANYRDTIEEIMDCLRDVKNCLPVKLIGHKEGITQKQQLETIQKFEQNVYNCIVTTSIGEEGLSIGTLDLAVFYDNVPSAIRRIQREGRVARVKPGKIFYLTVKDSIDSAYHWKSRRDEKNMKKTIESIKTKLESQQPLSKYTIKNESNS